MPKTEEILNGLQKIVNDYSTIAFIWQEEIIKNLRYAGFVNERPV